MSDNTFKRMFTNVQTGIQSGISTVQAGIHNRHGNSTFYTGVLRQRSLRDGWLRKQGGVMRTWQRRWLTIKGDHMYCFATEDESKPPVTFIFLPGNEVHELPFNNAEPDKYLFEISSANSHDGYVLCAASDDERKSWVQTVRKVIYQDKGGAIFGQSLEDTMKFESLRSHRKIPSIVQKCVEFITEKGLDMEGLFRLPGRAAMIRKLRQAFDCAEVGELDDEYDLHTVASLLKQYLRELPSPLIPTNFYETVSRIVNRELPINPEAAIQDLAETLAQIPTHNYTLLQYLCRFLNQVASNSEMNKMTDMNLATIFAQSFIRPDTDDPALLMGTSSSRAQVVFVLINQCPVVFKLEYTARGETVRVDNLLDLDNDLASGKSFDAFADSHFTAPREQASDAQTLLDQLECIPCDTAVILPAPLAPGGTNGHGVTPAPGPLQSGSRAAADTARSDPVRYDRPVLRSQPSLRSRGHVLIDGSLYDGKEEAERVYESLDQVSESDDKESESDDDDVEETNNNEKAEEDISTAAVSERRTHVRSLSAAFESHKPTPMIPPRPSIRQIRASVSVTEALAYEATESPCASPRSPPKPNPRRQSTGNLLAAVASDPTHGEGGVRDSATLPVIPPRPKTSQPAVSPAASVETIASSVNEEGDDDADEYNHRLLADDVSEFSREDLLSHVDSLRQELSARTSNVKDLKTKLREFKQKHSDIVKRIAEKLDSERNATADAVDQVVKVKAELEQYYMKYGPLQ